MRFSIIIPIYNTTAYLEDCLNSLLYQDFPKDKYELILVDDASTENIALTVDAILEEYTNLTQARQPQVHLLRHTQNKRQGGARNTGLQVASGDYVIFLDSDDLWATANVLTVFDTILASGQFDILRSLSWLNVSLKFNETYQMETIPCDMKISQISGEDYLKSNRFFYEIWTSCYKRSFLLQKKLFFRENVVFEDSDWSIKVCWYANNIGLITFPYYVYRTNPDSTTVKPRIQAFMDNVASVAAIDDFIQSVNMPDACKKACYKRIKDSILSFIQISRNYPVAISLDCLHGIRPRLLSDPSLYDDLSSIERFQFLLLRYCPIMIVVLVRSLVLTKRFVLKCLKR